MSESKHHPTPRRVVSIVDELWNPFQDLAEYRHISASALVRQLMMAELEKARISGEMRRVRARRTA
jgi:hypothetical protein